MKQYAIVAYESCEENPMYAFKQSNGEFAFNFDLQHAYFTEDIGELIGEVDYLTDKALATNRADWSFDIVDKSGNRITGEELRQYLEPKGE